VIRFVSMSGNVAQLEEHRAALTGHCYRMLGSAVDARPARRLAPFTSSGPGAR
jgi:hypothetical protein